MTVHWEQKYVRSPRIIKPVPILLAQNIPYVKGGHRLQTLTVYAPLTLENKDLIGTQFDAPPFHPQESSGDEKASKPCWLVHIHGGAWRDPLLDASSIEATVAHAFQTQSSNVFPSAIISINYTLSPFPTHPEHPYDPILSDPDTTRDARHPDHIKDVLKAFSLLQSMGLEDDSYVLTGHSAGACLAFQAFLYPPTQWEENLENSPSIPRPAAIIGMNGLYDLPDLVDNLGASHAHLRDVYDDLLGFAFSYNLEERESASPSRFDASWFASQIKLGKGPRLVVLDQSPDDQLVPVSQTETFLRKLELADGLQIIRTHHCKGKHAMPWESGYMIWELLLELLGKLEERGT